MKLWPVPFGGITYAMRYPSRDDLNAAIKTLLDCPGHYHNFAVQVDGLTLHMSANAADCLGSQIDSAAEWWTTTDVATYLGVRVATVSSYRRRQQMPAPDMKLGRTQAWRPATIINWRPRPRVGGRP